MGVALGRATLGLEGIVESFRLSSRSQRLWLRWRSTLIEVQASIEHFPHLLKVRRGQRLRLLDVTLSGLRHQPEARMTSYSEAFILED